MGKSRLSFTIEPRLNSKIGRPKVVFGSMALKMSNSRVDNISNSESLGKRKAGKREKIRGFTDRAKRKLLWRLQTVDYDSLRKLGYRAFFITLTYQDKFFYAFKNIKDCKDDLDTLDKRLGSFLKRSEVDYFYFWKLEFTKKGVPHFHLLLFCKSKNRRKFRVTRKNIIGLVNRFWVEVITRNIRVRDNRKLKGLEKIISDMFKAATNVSATPINKQRVLMAYMSKELAKKHQTEFPEEYTGRFWGVLNRAVYKRFILKKVREIDIHTYIYFRRILSKLLRTKGYNHKRRGLNGMSFFYVKDMSIMEKILDYF